MKHILIAGIPEGGKTHIGSYLEKEKGFLHKDIEVMIKSGQLKSESDFDHLINELTNNKKDIVVTWGFDPYHDVDLVQKFKDAGFRLFWFDADIQKAKEFYDNNPNKGYKRHFEGQVKNILDSGIIDKLNFIKIKTLHEDGSRINESELAEFIINQS